MNLINLKVRLKNPTFWLALVPAVLLLVQVVAAPFGYTFDFSILNQQAVAIVNAVFGVLSIIGIVVDPTTQGLSDSLEALGYDHPKTLNDEIGDTKVGGSE